MKFMKIMFDNFAASSLALVIQHSGYKLINNSFL